VRPYSSQLTGKHKFRHCCSVWLPYDQLRTKQLDLFPDDHQGNVGSKAIKRHNSPISIQVHDRSAICVDYIWLGLPTEIQNRLVLWAQWVYVNGRGTSLYLKWTQVYLPADIWLLLPSFLVQTDIQALAGVCVTLWIFLQPLIKFKVTIKGDDSPKYALRKALVVTWTLTILDSVVEVDIGKITKPYRNNLGLYKVPYLLTPTLYTLDNAIPEMQRLHTIQLNNIIPSRTYIYTILSSPYLIHLNLYIVQLPKISTFPPTRCRKLTLMMITSWETIRSMLSQLATSLEYLRLKWCRFLPESQLQLPSFPCLQEIYFYQYYPWHIFLTRTSWTNSFI